MAALALTGVLLAAGCGGGRQGGELVDRLQGGRDHRGDGLPAAFRSRAS